MTLPKRTPLALLLALFFASGMAALVYEVLWLKELGRLFGVTSYATATTLTVFFLGLSAGTVALGNESARWENPLRLYAFLEIGIAATALLYFFLYDICASVLASLFAAIGYRPLLWLLVRFVLAVALLFPPAFFMGGTLPVMAQFLVRRPEEFGERASLLYAVNTIGAAVGALLAGFYLPRWLGFRESYDVAVTLNLIIGATTYIWSRRGDPIAHFGKTAPPPGSRTPVPVDPATPFPGAIWFVAAASGFLTLALEVLWTRMFAQVLQNSVYTFSAVLTVFLVSLGVGSVVARRLCRSRFQPWGVLFTLLAASGVLVGSTPDLFVAANGGLAQLSPTLGWNRYILSVFARAFLILGPPTLAIGAVFPFLMKIAEGHFRAAGPAIGRLASVNTIAAITGSLFAGFAMLPLFGLWPAIRLLGALYLVMAIIVVPRGRRRSLVRAGLAAGVIVLLVVLPQRDLARAWLDPGEGEELVEVTEGVHGTVAVVRRGEDLRMKVNNSYLLGTSQSAVNSRLMSHLPLALHPDPRRVFYLGMGTGITAGGVLDFPVDSVVVCELNSDVIDASRRHFTPFANGLFEDPRVHILAEDGRNFLAATPRSYDMIIADIFLTYRVGVGSLYTREHFETVRERLAPGGMFVQWLTMFDLSEPEFGIIARTMLGVFDEVTLWRRGFSPKFPVYALIARSDGTPLDAGSLRARIERLVAEDRIPQGVWVSAIPLAAYAGNLRVAADRFSDFPISTDDRIPLEYLAPVTERNSKGSGEARVLAWVPLVDLCFEILRAAPPDQDPYLSGVARADRDQVVAGVNFCAYETYRRLGDQDRAGVFLGEYERAVSGGETRGE